MYNEIEWIDIEKFCIFEKKLCMCVTNPEKSDEIQLNLL